MYLVPAATDMDAEYVRTGALLDRRRLRMVACMTFTATVVASPTAADRTGLHTRRLSRLRKTSLASATSGILLVVLLAADLPLSIGVFVALAAGVVHAGFTLKYKGDWLVSRVARHDLWAHQVPVVIKALTVLGIVLLAPHLWWWIALSAVGLVAERFAYGKTGAMAAITLVGDIVRTPVHTLHHEKTGRTVTLIAASAVGTVDYFAALSERLIAARRAGVAVHYEGLRAPSIKRLSSASTMEVMLVNTFGVIAEQPLPVPTSLGLRDAGQSLVIPYTSRNVDLDHLDAIRAGAANGLGQILSVRHVTQSVPVPFALTHPRAAIALARLVTALTPIRPRHHLFLESRRTVALIAAWSALAHRDVLMSWGPTHTPAFIRSFRAAGYTLTGTDWLDVLDIAAIRHRTDGATPVIVPIRSDPLFDSA
jgi:hypothetical protein